MALHMNTGNLGAIHIFSNVVTRYLRKKIKVKKRFPTSQAKGTKLILSIE